MMTSPTGLLQTSSASGSCDAVPELLAPAGNWECARAAVENGADAIYFGLGRFNARMRADNFTEGDLPALMAFLHRRGVRGYVTFNTLIFPEELPAAREYLRAIIAAGVDAAIVQDVGICRLIRELSHDFPIHASTQMTVTSTAGVEFVRELGCQLVVLARECSMKEIGEIRTTLADRGTSIPLEVFVHGALCVAYSGQCLTSEALGGRSANRGECAQACRMPYDLIANEQIVPLGDRRYLLSPQDLAGLPAIADLARTGVASLKIEGRLKSPEYVAGITRVYRAALDRLRADVPPPETVASDRYELEMSFSRGLHTGWLHGIDNQRLVHARFGKKRGVFLGVIRLGRGDQVYVDAPQAPIKPGDGVVFDASRPDQPEQGGRVYAVERNGSDGGLAVSFGRGDIDLTKLRAGDRLWKTNDPELDRRLRQTFAGDTPRFRRPVDFEVYGHAGSPLTLIARDRRGHVAQLDSVVPLAVAEHLPLTNENLSAQLGRLGGSPFVMDTLTNRLDGEVILPVSELNRLRREAVTQLGSQRARPPRWELREESPEAAVNTPLLSNGPPDAELIVLVRDLAQLDATLSAGVATVYCDFEDTKLYREAVRRFRAHPASGEAMRTIRVAPPRIFKPGEDWILKQVRSSEADGFLVRNYDHLRFFAGLPGLVGDFSLNVANALSARYFMERGGLARLTASYDLNTDQLASLLRSAPPEWFEITVHQHMPMFHMEHCVFCAFLSSGTDYRNCGRPCDKQTVRLRDRVGLEHPLKADAGCRNTVFNARAQTGAESATRLRALGARHFRLEFVQETPEALTVVLDRYRALLRGEIDGAALWRELKLQNQLGVTRGQMDREDTRKVFPRC